MTRNRMVWPATLAVVVLVLSGCDGHQSTSHTAAAAAGSMSGSFAETLPSGGAADGTGAARAPDAGTGSRRRHCPGEHPPRCIRPSRSGRPWRRSGGSRNAVRSSKFRGGSTGY